MAQRPAAPDHHPAPALTHERHRRRPNCAPADLCRRRCSAPRSGAGRALRLWSNAVSDIRRNHPPKNRRRPARLLDNKGACAARHRAHALAARRRRLAPHAVRRRSDGARLGALRPRSASVSKARAPIRAMAYHFGCCARGSSRPAATPASRSTAPCQSASAASPWPRGPAISGSTSCRGLISSLSGRRPASSKRYCVEIAARPGLTPSSCAWR